MKRIILIVTSIIMPIVVQAQSDSLTQAYKQVCNTLKEYKFVSEDANDGYGKTVSITLKVQNGDFVFAINDDFWPFNGPEFGHRHGIKTLKVPYNDVSFDLWYKMELRCKNGIELTYEGKKDLIESYEIHGEKLTLQKLAKELQLLQSIAINEDFKGTLGGGSTSPKKSTQKTAQSQPPAQTQQKPRNRIPAGN